MKNLKQIKGRNHFTATSTFKLDGIEVPITVEFKRVKYSNAF